MTEAGDGLHASTRRPARPANAAEVARLLGGRLEGAGDLPVHGIDALDSAPEDHASFAGDEAHARRIGASRSRVIVISEALDAGSGAEGRALVRVPDAERAIIILLEAFAPEPILPPPGIHAMAIVGAGTAVPADARIGAFVSIGARVRLGARVVVHDGARILDDCEIGDDCVIHANAIVRERSRLGHRIVLHAGAIIGSDGFGYRPSPDGRGLRRVPHLGTVRIEDDVEIGAGTCVDRAKFGETIIGAGTKIDNLCQIGHNVRVGRSCVIAGLSGIAGSAVIGDGSRIGGQVGIADHIRIGRGVTLAAASAVMNDVPDGATWGGLPAQDARAALRELSAVRRLPDWSRRLKQMLDGEQS